MRRNEREKLARLIIDLNDLLGTPMPMAAKSTICTMIEHTLMDHDVYGGFNNRYWLEQGCKEWQEAGEPSFPEKEAFICGPEGCKHRNHKSVYTSDIQGEYSRRYYLGKLLKWVDEVK